MAKRASRKATSKITAVAALALLMGLFLAMPASAHHRANHSGGSGADTRELPASVSEKGAKANDAASDKDGDADSDASTAFTEDTDSDGVANNIADEGDNAHPSGKDRSVENGSSGNQGKAESKPDQNGKGPERDNRGTDKANGPGGADIHDQDGNNGCGNDDDFDDDNEGWCGGKNKGDNPPKDNPPKDNPPKDNPPKDNPPKDNPPKDNPPGNTPPGSTPPGSTPPGSTPPSTTVVGSTTPATEAVLGVIVTRGREEGAVLGAEAVRDQALAFTGTSVAPLLGVGFVLLATGVALTLEGRRRARA
jgi:hypothetical protein